MHPGIGRDQAMGNTTHLNYSVDRSVPQLVAMQAVVTPEATALVDGPHSLSYRELNQRANQLAHYLLTLDVRPNTLVGLCIDRSCDLIIGLLGILKAGGAYVPLDATYPSERLTFMLNDVQIPVLVTQQSLSIRLDTSGTRVICLDTDAITLAEQSTSNPDVAVTTTDLAYVIYTSGSTGQPKGVQITHGSLLNLVYWYQRAFAVTSSDRSSQFFSPAFDAAGSEIWPYLTIGASVYFIDQATRINAHLLRDWLVDQAITIATLPTLLAESMTELEWSTTTALRFLQTGGDTLHHYPPSTLPFTLINNYGPTEATVVSTSGPVLPNTRSDRLPSIGRPIDNVNLYILDEDLQQLETGEPGEIYVGGVGLAKGYLNRPELTAQKFISNPFSDDADARLYKTGDLARFLPGGEIEFLGRVDHQVKIRGFRIELGEIEVLLDQHPAVQQAIVIAREDTPAEKRLVAYIVLNQNRHITSNELYHFLKEQLPDYMIPSVFVKLDALPLASNGKTGRDGLPVPDTANIIRDEFIAAYNNAIEERLALIMSSVLGVECVGRDDNFFLLGGHSLLATQVILCVTEEFGIDLPLHLLFDKPVIQELSVEIEHYIIAKLEAMSEDELSHLSLL